MKTQPTPKPQHVSHATLDWLRQLTRQSLRAGIALSEQYPPDELYAMAVIFRELLLEGDSLVDLDLENDLPLLVLALGRENDDAIAMRLIDAFESRLTR